MNLEEFKVASDEQLKAYGELIPLGYTYDSNKNELTYKNSDGYWTERTYDTTNNLLTYKDSNGINRVGLIKGVKYTLWYAIDSKQYKAGCKELSYTECIEFYEEFKDEHEDSNLFLETIKKHNLTLGK